MAKAEKILVVDDERGIRYLLSDVLSDAGFEVSMAKDGQESLDQLEDNRFDLVITDINMPRLDGIEMLKRMKMAGRKEKVIIMTANLLDLKFEEAEVPHVVTQLQKPFRIDSFLDMVIATVKNGKHIPGMGPRQTAAGGGF
ncbi:MAG: response regulator [Deltaproteobacteria bacterium]|nr:response regulator [Deltaproteobacteria bacterium]